MSGFLPPRPRQARPERSDEAPPGPRGFRGIELKKQSRAGGLKSPPATARCYPQPQGTPGNKRQHPTREGLGSFLDPTEALGMLRRDSSFSSPSLDEPEPPARACRRWVKALHPDASHPARLPASQRDDTLQDGRDQPSLGSPPARTCQASPTQAMVSINDKNQVPVPLSGIYSAVKGETVSPPQAPGEQPQHPTDGFQQTPYFLKNKK